MSRSRSPIVAVAAILLVVLFAVSALNLAAVAPSNDSRQVVPLATPTPLLSGDSVVPTDPIGYTQDSFSTGYDDGNVYFAATDTAGDTSAVVSINDLNATRDGITNPVATWTISFVNTTYNESATWGAHLLLPLTLVDGGLWNITISGKLAGFSHTDFYVSTYFIEVEAEQPAVLPGHAVVLDYQIASTVNDAPYSAAAANDGPTAAVSSIQVAGQYYARNFTSESWFGKSPMSATPADWGTFSAPMPLNVANGTRLLVTFWANVTAATVNTSELYQVAVGIGSLDSSSVGLSLGACPYSCQTGAYSANAPAYLSITGTIEGIEGDAPAAGLSATIDFVGVAAGALGSIGTPPTHLTLNATGQAAIVFTMSPTAFSLYKTHTINVTIFDPSVANTTVTSSVTFEVVPNQLAVPTLSVSFGQSVYQGGSSAVVTWALGGQNTTVTTGWTVDDWYAFAADGTDGSLLAWGAIGSSNQTGTFAVNVPGNYTGALTVYVTAYNATDSIGAEDVVAILAPQIELNPSELVYSPGDTLTVSVVLDGASLSGATLFVYVAGDGYVFENGILTGTTITVQVPKVSAPSSITFDVTATSPTTGLLTSSTLTLYEADGYLLIVSISTASKYTDGSFQPGETITLNYHLVVVGIAQSPALISLYIESEDFEEDSPEAYGGAVLFSSLPVSGSVSYTIPGSSSSGSNYFYVDAEFPSAHCPDYDDEEFTPGQCGYESEFTVMVNPNPSALEYQVVPNSGLTVGWLILLALIIVVALVLWFTGHRRGGSKSTMSSSSSSSSGSTPSMGSSPDTGTGASGPAAWQSPSNSPESSGPPLPTPPAGPGNP